MILIVEDHIDSAKMLARLLRAHGYETAVAHCGHDALAAIRALRPALVLSDCMMPDLDGPELVRRARAEGLLDGVPVVMYSATSDPAVIADGMAAGAAAWVTKGQIDLLFTRIAELHKR